MSDWPAKADIGESTFLLRKGALFDGRNTHSNVRVFVFIRSIIISGISLFLGGEMKLNFRVHWYSCLIPSKRKTQNAKKIRACCVNCPNLVTRRRYGYGNMRQMPHDFRLGRTS
jgi:hypothetical protein